MCTADIYTSSRQIDKFNISLLGEGDPTGSISNITNIVAKLQTPPTP